MYNFHTHTQRCNHAIGEDREYVESAIKGGITDLGFSDHCPYFFDGNYYSDFRMRPQLVDDYVNSVLSLKKEYAKDINVYLGFETEYYPKYFDKLMDFLSQYPVDYMLLGQHFIGNETDEGSYYSGFERENQSFLTSYVNQVIQAFDTGKFTYLAHPDLVNFTGDRDFYLKEMDRLCKSAKEHNISLEYNMLGLFYNRCYPNNAFWQLVEKNKNDVVIGFDAHITKPLGDKKYYDTCYNNLKALGITPLEKLNLVKPF